VVPQVHQCPRCELRFATLNELREHLALDHAVLTDVFDRYRYPGSSAQEELHRDTRPALVLVANQTLEDESVLAAVVDLAGRRGGTPVLVVVPATHSSHQDVPVGGPPGGAGVEGTDDVGVALARWRLRRAVDRLHELGVEAEGRLGPPDPLSAVMRAVAGRPVEEIVVATLPRGRSRWLDVDVVGQLAHHTGLPVHALPTTR
jgi:hypothetical protein